MPASVSHPRSHRVLLVGPPGAGKTSQGMRLAELLRVSHLSTGSLLRDEVRRASPIGRQAAAYMNSGRLVPDWLVLYSLEVYLSDVIGPGFVLDGYPRTVEQAERFLRSLGQTRLDRVIELATPDDVVVERLTSRSVCGNCGHAEASRALTTCPLCGGTMQARLDDDEPVIRSRLATYHAQSAPMVSFFRNGGLLVTVDGDRPREIVASELCDLLQRDPGQLAAPAEMLAAPAEMLA